MSKGICVAGLLAMDMVRPFPNWWTRNQSCRITSRREPHDREEEKRTSTTTV